MHVFNLANRNSRPLSQSDRLAGESRHRIAMSGNEKDEWAAHTGDGRERGIWDGFECESSLKYSGPLPMVEATQIMNVPSKPGVYSHGI